MPTLDFKGKQHIYAHHLAVQYRPLIPDADKSVKRDTDGGAADAPPDDNLIIHGDNLHALKALLPRYANRVKCIYIDPPYNTGNEGWVYNDKVNSPLMRQWLKDNGAVDGEDLERHDKWLCMMWPRLQLLRELLADDGVIFVSIDDNEQHHLRMLMDEIFGDDNFVTNISWQSRTSVQNDTDISVNHEHILAYAKIRRKTDRRLKRSNAERWHTTEGFAMYPAPLSDNRFSNPDNDPRGLWRADLFHAPNIRPNLTYEIQNPVTGEKFLPPESRCWRMTQDRYLEALADNRIVFGKSGEGKPQLKVFYNEVAEYGRVETTWFDAPNNGTAALGTQELEAIFGIRKVFQHPKPTQVIEHLLRLSTKEDALILDSFAGSGTTAHAVLALNNEDGGNRKFILVECEDYADSITAERVRRVINGVPAARDKALKDGLGGSFTYCELGDPIEAESMLTGEALPTYSALAAYLIHTATGASVGQSALAPQNADGLFYTFDETAFYMLYEPDLEWLCSNAGMLTAERADRIAAAVSASAAKRAIVFAPGKYIGQRELTARRITFCQLPYEMRSAAGA